MLDALAAYRAAGAAEKGAAAADRARKLRESAVESRHRTQNTELEPLNKRTCELPGQWLGARQGPRPRSFEFCFSRSAFFACVLILGSVLSSVSGVLSSANGGGRCGHGPGGIQEEAQLQNARAVG